MDDMYREQGSVGAKIIMIKAIRQYTGLGLVQAKHVADAISTAYVPDATPPHTDHAHSAYAVALAPATTCLHCKKGLVRRDWGAIFCGEVCAAEYAAHRQQDNATYLVDQEIASLEFKLAEARAARDRLNRTAE